MRTKALLLPLMLLTIGVASAQPLPPPAQQLGSVPGAFGGSRHLYASGTLGSNGADTAQDVLQTMTLAAGQLASVGDTINIKSGGSFASTTDNKAIRLVLGGQVIGSVNGTGAGTVGWYCDAQVTKTGSNTQSYISGCPLLAGNANTRSGTLTLTDTGAIVLQVTGQNNTTAAAGSITAQVLTVDYWH